MQIIFIKSPKIKNYKSKNSMLEEIVVLLGGRVAEAITLSDISSGASNDIERATELARNMITIYGMSDKFGMVGLESIQNKYLDGRRVEGQLYRYARFGSRAFRGCIKRRGSFDA